MREIKRTVSCERLTESRGRAVVSLLPRKGGGRKLPKIIETTKIVSRTLHESYGVCLFCTNSESMNSYFATRRGFAFKISIAIFITVKMHLRLLKLLVCKVNKLLNDGFSSEKSAF